TTSKNSKPRNTRKSIFCLLSVYSVCSVVSFFSDPVEQRRLGAGLAAATAAGGGRPLAQRHGVRLQLRQHFLRPAQHFLRYARQLRDMDTVALVGAAGRYLVHENDLVLPLAHHHVVV